MEHLSKDDWELIDKYNEYLAKLSDQHNDKHYSWYRQILTISIGLFGLLVTLHDSPQTGYYAKMLFSASIVLLSLAIFSGTIYLFSEQHTVKKLRNQTWTEMQKLMRGENSGDFESNFHIKASNVFLFFRWIFILSLSFCLPVLVIYALMLNN